MEYDFILAPLALCFVCQCGCGTRTEHLASWVPKARMTDTHVPLTTYPYRSLDSIYSMTLLALSHSHTHKAHIQHIHSTSYIHTQIGKGMKTEEKEGMKTVKKEKSMNRKKKRKRKERHG